MVKVLTVLNFSAIAAEKLLYSHKDQTWKEFKKRKMVKKNNKQVKCSLNYVQFTIAAISTK